MDLTNYEFEFNPTKEIGEIKEYRLVIYDTISEAFSHKIIVPVGESIILNQDNFDEHLFYKYKYQVKSDDNWIDISKYQNLSIEKVDENGLKYMYYHQPNSPYLIVVFQALNKTPSYNYVGILKDVAVSKLYIKDDYGYDPTKATYYLGKNKKFTISNNVISLIEKVRTYNQLEKNKVILAGSSKGGFAAIYHSFAGEYGYAIAGGPQLFLGKYLGENLKNSNSIKPPIFRYITGGLNEKDKEWADSILPNLIEHKVKENTTNIPTVHIHVGVNEPHYKEHILPFLTLMESHNLISRVLLDLGDYSLHEDLAKHFPKFFKENVINILNENNSGGF